MTHTATSPISSKTLNRTHTGNESAIVGSIDGGGGYGGYQDSGCGFLWLGFEGEEEE